MGHSIECTPRDKMNPTPPLNPFPKKCSLLGSVSSLENYERGGGGRPAPPPSLILRKCVQIKGLPGQTNNHEGIRHSVETDACTG